MRHLIAVLVLAGCAFAACHVVNPANVTNGTGANWTDAAGGAFNTIPATLVRGDTYYLADGIYPIYVFTTADSTTTVITIKKAIASDHCADTGWNTGTMGSGQAVFTPSGASNFGVGFRVRSDYFTLDGNGRT